MMVQNLAPTLDPIKLADIYFEAKSKNTISLRNLSRCLAYYNKNCSDYGYKRALHDALLLGFKYNDMFKNNQN